MWDGSAVHQLMMFGLYALIYGIPIGGAAILTLVAAMFIGIGWWMVAPMLIATAISVILDKSL